MDWPILSTIILIPLLGSLTILLINSEDEIGKRNIKIVALYTCIVNFLASIFLWVNFDKLSSEFQKACKNDMAEAVKLDKILQPLHSSLFIESNPSPVKYAASLLKMCSPSVRLPLVEIRDETKKKVSEALKAAKLL